jgi:hypothetical protein
MQWDLVWRLYRPLRGLCPLIATEGPRHSHRRGVAALSMHAAPSAIRIVVVPTGLKVLLGLHNQPCSWANTMGPSLLGFTIVPCVDSFLCYMIDQVA